MLSAIPGTIIYKSIIVNFYKPESLPRLMVAPNGARPSKKDHPAVPVTISETVETAKACFKSGATGIHFHMRDEKGQHILDSGLCKEALNELQKKGDEKKLISHSTSLLVDNLFLFKSI